MLTIEQIKKVIAELTRLECLHIEIKESSIVIGQLRVFLSNGNNNFVDFKFRIEKYFPLDFRGQSSIAFFNENLIHLPHIMADGKLCLHDVATVDPELRLRSSLLALKQWCRKYLIEEAIDEHYEYPVYNEQLPITVLYTQPEHAFIDDDFGLISLNNNFANNESSTTVLITKFNSCLNLRESENKCQFHPLRKFEENAKGIYCFIDAAPVKDNKFLVSNFERLVPFLTNGQKKHIAQYIRYNNKCFRIKSYLPILIGYKMPNQEVHWLSFFINADPYQLSMNNSLRQLKGQILWGKSDDISYGRFYGRGAFPKDFCNTNILIVGVGALGSSLATALVRGGCRNIAIYDYDNKEMGNICRSEYRFLAGTVEKVIELKFLLEWLSPFFYCTIATELEKSILKTYLSGLKNIQELNEYINQFDIIFDCTTDESLAILFDKLSINGQHINLSISNEAKEFVCVFSPNINDSLTRIYKILSNFNEQDLYYPTGCWNPTFKANYSEIQSKLHLGLNEIVQILMRHKPKANFYIENTNNGLNINMI